MISVCQACFSSERRSQQLPLPNQLKRFCLQPCQVQTEETDKKMHLKKEALEQERQRRRMWAAPSTFEACMRDPAGPEHLPFQRSERVFAIDKDLFKALMEEWKFFSPPYTGLCHTERGEWHANCTKLAGVCTRARISLRFSTCWSHDEVLWSLCSTQPVFFPESKR